MIDWLCDHEQACKDCADYFDIDPQDLGLISFTDLTSWIAEHDQLASDFEDYFGVNITEVADELKNFFNESLKESLSKKEVRNIFEKNGVKVNRFKQDKTYPNDFTFDTFPTTHQNMERASKELYNLGIHSDFGKIHAVNDDPTYYVGQVYGVGLKESKSKRPFGKSLKESTDDSVRTVEIYGDEVRGFDSVGEIANYFKKKRIEVSNVSGDMDYGWEMDLTGDPKTLFFAICNVIPGYNCDSVQEFIDQYAIDED